MLHENYCARSEAYINAMKDMFMQIPQNVEIALTSKGKTKKLLTDIGGGSTLALFAIYHPPPISVNSFWVFYFEVSAI